MSESSLYLRQWFNGRVFLRWLFALTGWAFGLFQVCLGPLVEEARWGVIVYDLSTSDYRVSTNEGALFPSRVRIANQGPRFVESVTVVLHPGDGDKIRDYQPYFESLDRSEIKQVLTDGVLRIHLKGLRPQEDFSFIVYTSKPGGLRLDVITKNGRAQKFEERDPFPWFEVVLVTIVVLALLVLGLAQVLILRYLMTKHNDAENKIEEHFLEYFKNRESSAKGAIRGKKRRQR